MSLSFSGRVLVGLWQSVYVSARKTALEISTQCCTWGFTLLVKLSALAESKAFKLNEKWYLHPQTITQTCCMPQKSFLWLTIVLIQPLMIHLHTNSFNIVHLLSCSKWSSFWTQCPFSVMHKITFIDFIPPWHLCPVLCNLSFVQIDKNRSPRIAILQHLVFLQDKYWCAEFYSDVSDCYNCVVCCT